MMVSLKLYFLHKIILDFLFFLLSVRLTFCGARKIGKINHQDGFPFWNRCRREKEDFFVRNAIREEETNMDDYVMALF